MSVLCKNWIVALKIKVTVRVQNFIESLYILCTSDPLTTKLSVLMYYN